MKLYIKNMVCNRCKMVVKAEFEKFGLHPQSIELGEVEVAGKLSQDQLHRLNKQLTEFGFELLDDKKSRTIEKVKNAIISLVYDQDNHLKTNLSDYLSSQIGQDYNYISKLFSQHESTTIEQYYMLQRIERVKELIVYDELNLNQIADQMHYSSASHLTKQFKKVTGLTPSHFKSLKHHSRTPIENL